jgi:hypothetical protein
VGAVLAHADAVPVAVADDPELRRRRDGGARPARAQRQGEHEAGQHGKPKATTILWHPEPPATAFANPRRVGAAARGLEQAR